MQERGVGAPRRGQCNRDADRPQSTTALHAHRTSHCGRLSCFRRQATPRNCVSALHACLGDGKLPFHGSIWSSAHGDGPQAKKAHKERKAELETIREEVDDAVWTFSRPSRQAPILGSILSSLARCGCALPPHAIRRTLRHSGRVGCAPSHSCEVIGRTAPPSRRLLPAPTGGDGEQYRRSAGEVCA